jgi:hypothetical protein
VKKNICVCAHDAARLGLALKCALLVHRPNVGQYEMKFRGSPEQFSLNVGTAVRADAGRWEGRRWGGKAANGMETRRGARIRRIAAPC